MSWDKQTEERLRNEHREARHAACCWKCDVPWPCPTIAALDEIRRLEAQYQRDHEAREWVRKMHHDSQTLRIATLEAALNRVLTEAGLQAHKHGCPNRLARPARWDEFAPCAGCQGEDALAVQEVKP